MVRKIQKDSESQGISVEGFKKDNNFASRVSNDSFSKVEECVNCWIHKRFKNLKLRIKPGEIMIVISNFCYACNKLEVEHRSYFFSVFRVGNFTLLHSGWPKLHRVLAVLSAIRVKVLMSFLV